MSESENALFAEFAKLPPDRQREADLAASEMLLRQAAYIGIDEYLRVAKELGGNVVDVIVRLPGDAEYHYDHRMVA